MARTRSRQPKPTRRPRPTTGGLRPLLPKPAANPASTPPCHFSKLPPELRRMIYDELFNDMTVSRHFQAASFLRSNREINEEMITRLHERFSFIVVHDFSAGFISGNSVGKHLSTELANTSWTCMSSPLSFTYKHPVRMTISLTGSRGRAMPRRASYVAIADLHLHDVCRAIGGMTYGIDLDIAGENGDEYQDPRELQYQVEIQPPQNPDRNSAIPVPCLLKPIHLYWHGLEDTRICGDDTQIGALAESISHTFQHSWFDKPNTFLELLEALRQRALQAVVESRYILAAECMRDFEHFFKLYEMNEDEFLGLIPQKVIDNDIDKYRWEFILPFARPIYMHAAAKEGPDAELWSRQADKRTYDGYHLDDGSNDVVYELASFGMPNANMMHCTAINALLQGQSGSALELLNREHLFLSSDEDFRGSQYQKAFLEDHRHVFKLSLCTYLVTSEVEGKVCTEETKTVGKCLLRKWFGKPWQEYAKELLVPKVWAALQS